MGIIIEVKAVLFVTTLPLPFPPSSLQLGNFFHMYEVDILKKKMSFMLHKSGKGYAKKKCCAVPHKKSRMYSTFIVNGTLRKKC